jgi:hypothetical protein
VEHQFVHALEIPAQGSQRAMDLECHLALGTAQNAVDLEAALGPVGKLHEGADVIFVGHRPFGAAAADREISPLSGCRQRPLVDECMAPEGPSDS